MRKLIAALALFAFACGGGEPASDQAEPETPATQDEPAMADHTGTGTVHEVRMLLTDDGNYVYDPSTLTIKVGDTVRWVNVNDVHNVAFYGDQIPPAAAEALESLMPAEAKLGPLSGRLISQPNDAYEITFAGVPTGDYGYFCTPHEALGMTATLTVEN